MSLKMISVAALLTGVMGTSFVASAAPIQSEKAADKASYKKAVEAAISNEKRRESFIAYDQGRKPASVLSVAKVKAGMTVVDINSGGGYYSEILASLVGEKGTVYAHNGSGFWNYMKKTVPANLANFPSIKPMNEGSELINLPENSVDVVMNVLAYHDYYGLLSAEKGETRLKVNKSIFKALKKGGSYVIVDHLGQQGMSEEDIKSLHRIDPLIVMADMEAAGFSFDGMSTALVNKDDALDEKWFGKKPRYNTNRFIYHFKKK